MFKKVIYPVAFSKGYPPCSVQSSPSGGTGVAQLLCLCVWQQSYHHVSLKHFNKQQHNSLWSFSGALGLKLKPYRSDSSAYITLMKFVSIARKWTTKQGHLCFYCCFHIRPVLDCTSWMSSSIYPKCMETETETRNISKP